MHVFQCMYHIICILMIAQLLFNLFNVKETMEMPGSRGVAHLVMKCKFCKKDMNLSNNYLMS